MNHILLGASIPFAIGIIFYALNRFRASLPALIIFPFIAGLSAIWAIVPDIPRLLGMTRLYSRMSFDPHSDIFFRHYTIDLTEAPSHWHTAGFLSLFLLLIIVAIREVYLSEKKLKRP